MFGGYSLLSIAMYGYIGDVTSTRERTMMIAVLGALGMVMMPLADFCGGQIYRVGKSEEKRQTEMQASFLGLSCNVFCFSGGYLAVYSTSLGFIFIGIIYIWLIPESVTLRSHTVTGEEEDQSGGEKPGLLGRAWAGFCSTNHLLWETLHFVFRDQSNSTG